MTAGAWAMVGYVWAQVMRLGSSLILTRLLFPEAFGLMALVYAYITGLVMFSDMGLHAFLFQSKRVDQEMQDGIWSLAIVRGVGVWLVACLAAIPVSWFYAQPRLLHLLPVAAAVQLIDGFISPKLVLARRELKQRLVVTFDMNTQLVSMLAMLALAWWLRSVWALVISSLVTEATRAILSHFYLPGPRNRWRWDPQLVKQLRRFSGWVYVSSAMTFVGGQTDRIVLGKLMPLDFLGVYGIATNFALLPLALVNQCGGLLAPITVQLRHVEGHIGQEIRDKLQTARSMMLGAGAVLVAGMCTLAPAFYGLLYDHRYANAGFMASLLAVGVWFSVLDSSVSGLLLAFGDARANAWISLAKLMGSLTGATGGFAAAGAYGLIVGLSLGSLSAYVATLVLLERHEIRLRFSDVTYCAAFVALTILGWGAILLAHIILPTVPMPLASLVAALLVGGVGLAYQWSAIRYLWETYCKRK